jgi:hypothetical protein
MSKSRYLVQRLDYLVQDTRKKIPLYRRMYGGASNIESLDHFIRLPILTDSVLANERLENTLAGLDQVCITRTFGDDTVAAGQLPKLLSYEDVLDEYKVLSFMTEFASLEGEQKVLLLGDEQNIYTIAEMGKYLAYYQWPLAVFIIRKHTIDKLAEHLAEFKPTVIFVDSSEALPTAIFPSSMKNLFTFSQPGVYEAARTGAQSFRCFDIFREPRIGLAAIKDQEHGHYTYDPRYFYFEAAANQRLLVTSFINSLQPVIRYELMHQGTITGVNKFVVTG